MPRVKRGPKRAQKRKRVLKLASGYWGTKSKAYRILFYQEAGGFPVNYSARLSVNH